MLDIYVDGSYSDIKKVASYGIVYVLDDTIIATEKGITDKYIDTRNVVGELTAASRAIIYAINNNYRDVNIHYDYEGIEKWVTGEWATKKECTANYKKFINDNKLKYNLNINFIKVKGHSGNKYNDIADMLAKEALV